MIHRAFKHDELKNDTPDVDAEWGKFASSHSEELETLDEGDYKPCFVLHLQPAKLQQPGYRKAVTSGIGNNNDISLSNSL